ncbi:MAG: hypothetical protein JSS11_08210 [Verrucomicrobia bacterium]|nr:hypothetical protein [Verrucomicrobiota bacterium]
MKRLKKRKNMDTSQYFQALSAELHSLENRVRNFIAGAHWLTDGEWKESVLRSMLRRHLPRSIEVGRGFIVSANGNSGQIDVLIYSADAPVLFRDGDLVFVTPDAVLGIIEVKSNISSSKALHKALKKMTRNARIANRKKINDKFFGLFAYNATFSMTEALDSLATAANGDSALVTNLVCLGERDFIRWSIADPTNTQCNLGIWRGYNRLEGKAVGYFLHNVIQLLAPKSVGQNLSVWFPMEGKDTALAGERPFEPRYEPRYFEP